MTPLGRMGRANDLSERQKHPARVASHASRHTVHAAEPPSRAPRTPPSSTEHAQHAAQTPLNAAHVPLCAARTPLHKPEAPPNTSWFPPRVSRRAPNTAETSLRASDLPPLPLRTTRGSFTQEARRAGVVHSAGETEAARVFAGATSHGATMPPSPLFPPRESRGPPSCPIQAMAAWTESR